MNRFCLKSALIMDGTGEKGYIGDVLVENDRIKCVSKTPLEVDCPVIDCSGLAVSSGFIDSHSHQDMYSNMDNDFPMMEPFLRQGITTYVAGNCGYSPAGICTTSSVTNTQNPNNERKIWPTYAEYFDFKRKKGLHQNLAIMAGHGTALSSVVGNTPKGASTPEQVAQVVKLLEEGMDNGCKGISFGLGYRPGAFIPDTEVRKVCECAIKRNKLITVHSRIMGSRAVELYGEDFSIPHNVRWHRDFIELFRDSGARLQISHLLFVGRQAWPSYDAMFEMFDDMVENGGMDLWFDMYSYTQGATSIAIRMPQFFYDHLPEIYTDKSLWPKYEEELEKHNAGRGIMPHDVLLCNAFVPELKQYDGMFMDEVCKARNCTMGELYMELYQKTNGFATVYLMIEQPEENVAKQMVHPRALYMTDAWVETQCLQNPCTFGAMPKFLRIARETGNQSLEMTIAKMTGRAAKRFDLFGRGFVKPGYFADLVVFDPNTIAETATPTHPDQYPIGIHHVFVNGQHVVNGSSVDSSLFAGMML